MLAMDQVHDIRFRFFTKGETISHIAQELQMDWKTVRKYVDMTDFNSPPQTSFRVSIVPEVGTLQGNN